MVDPAVVREWIEKADEDYRFAEANLRMQDGFYSQICFHLQQAAEKYLKAFIIASELEFKKTHDLSQLLETCKEKAPSVEGLRKDSEFLNDFYVESRYPVHWPTHYTRDEAEGAQKAAMRIRDLVKALLAETTADSSS